MKSEKCGCNMKEGLRGYIVRERDGEIRSQDCRRGGMADASDSKSDGGNLVPVQVRPPAVY